MVGVEEAWKTRVLEEDVEKDPSGRKALRRRLLSKVEEEEYLDESAKRWREGLKKDYPHAFRGEGD